MVNYYIENIKNAFLYFSNWILVSSSCPCAGVYSRQDVFACFADLHSSPVGRLGQGGVGWNSRSPKLKSHLISTFAAVER